MIFIQILYDFRIREAFDLLRLDDFNIVNIALLWIIKRFEKISSISIIIIIITYLIFAKAFRKSAIISEYRFYYINIKKVITFVSLRIKKYHNAYYQFKCFDIDDLINFRFHKKYLVFVIKFKKIDF